MAKSPKKDPFNWDTIFDDLDNTNDPAKPDGEQDDLQMHGARASLDSCMSHPAVVITFSLGMIFGYYYLLTDGESNSAAQWGLGPAIIGVILAAPVVALIWTWRRLFG